MIKYFIDVTLAVGLVFALVVVSRADRGPAPEPTHDEVKVVTVVEPPKPPEPLRLAVTPPQWDDMGSMLDTLGSGYQHKAISFDELTSGDLRSKFDVIFLTCTDQLRPSEELSKALRDFVGRGGTLYASDWQFTQVAHAFPDFVDRNALQQGAGQQVVAEVVDPGLRDALGPNLPLKFDLGNWKPAAFQGQEVVIYLKAGYETMVNNVPTGKFTSAPLLVKFPYKEGAVIFTSFHNEKNSNEAELKLLRHLVFSAVTASVESKVSKTMMSSGFSPTNNSLLSASKESPSVTKTYTHKKAGGLQFVLGFAAAGAELRLSVSPPSGPTISRTGTSTVTIDVPDAPSGEWSYTVTALKVPYPNFPFTLTIGEK